MNRKNQKTEAICPIFWFFL